MKSAGKPMQVVRVDGVNGDTTYEVRDLTESEAAIVAALADFPLWGAQPDQVATVCETLHNAVCDVLPEPWRGTAEGWDMADRTTAN